jgi:hypothetical protein
VAFFVAIRRYLTALQANRRETWRQKEAGRVSRNSAAVAALGTVAEKLLLSYYGLCEDFLLINGQEEHSNHGHVATERSGRDQLTFAHN